MNELLFVDRIIRLGNLGEEEGVFENFVRKWA